MKAGRPPARRGRSLTQLPRPQSLPAEQPEKLCLLHCQHHQTAHREKALGSLWPAVFTPNPFSASLSLFELWTSFFPKQVVGKQNTLNTARRSYVPETEVRDWNLRLGFRKLRVKIPGSPQPECCTLGKLRHGAVALIRSSGRVLCRTASPGSRHTVGAQEIAAGQ